MSWFEAFTQYAEQRLDTRVRSELYARGVSDEQIQLFRIGYLDQVPSFDGGEDFAQWAKGKTLSGVFVLPLTTPLGEIRGFQFRSVERGRKTYLDYMPYKEEPVLFGLGQAMPHVWKAASIWVVEGAFDLLPLQRHVPNVVATLTARMPDSLLRVLRRLVSTIWLGYDSDATGQAAIKQFARKHGQEFRVVPVYYPRVLVTGSNRYVKDPGELWELWGDDQVGDFVKSLIQSNDPMEFPHA